MKFKYAPYWKQILALLIDGIVGFIIGYFVFIIIREQISISLELVVFIATLVMQMIFYYGYGDKSFGDHMLKLRVIFINERKGRSLNAFRISLAKTLMIVPYGIPLFGYLVALLKILITIKLQFIPEYREKKQTGWNITIAHIIDDNI